MPQCCASASSPIRLPSSQYQSTVLPAPPQPRPLSHSRSTKATSRVGTSPRLMQSPKPDKPPDDVENPSPPSPANEVEMSCPEVPPEDVGFAAEPPAAPVPVL